MPLFGGKKTLWKIKELSNYVRKIDGSEIPPIYNLEKVGDLHREIDANLRPYWENLHPIIQDFITAWNDAWSSQIHDGEDLQSQLQQKTNLIENLKSNFETKLNELNGTITSLKSQLQSKENEIEQKEQLIQDLEAADKESKLGITELRENLEKRLTALNQAMAQKQEKYEKTQIQVGQAFQRKVLELDSEMLALQEELKEKDLKIKEQEEKIKILEKESQKAKFYEVKVQNLQNKLNQIADILELEEINEEDNEYE
jgi:chromosome segregation ATPase